MYNNVQWISIIGILFKEAFGTNKHIQQLLDFFLFCFSCWMSSTGNLIWIFVSFVVAVEIVSETYSQVSAKN